MNRKAFLTTFFGGLAVAGTTWAARVAQVAGPFSLPALPFGFEALEPHFDKMTMEIHHGRHHQGYVNNLNAAVVGTALEKMSLPAILQEVSKHSTAVRNNGGGHWNHSFFWEILSPTPTKPSAALEAAIMRDFGSMEAMQTAFNAAAGSRFGSGWAWLILQNGKLKITSTPKQDNTLMDVAPDRGTPILGLDVWEHAYYLKYQNKRPDYVKAFWNVVNWNKVSQHFAG